MNFTLMILEIKISLFINNLRPRKSVEIKYHNKIYKNYLCELL